jgi:hypothetical protein
MGAKSPLVNLLIYFLLHVSFGMIIYTCNGSSDFSSEKIPVFVFGGYFCKQLQL